MHSWCTPEPEKDKILENLPMKWEERNDMNRLFTLPVLMLAVALASALAMAQAQTQPAQEQQQKPKPQLGQAQTQEEYQAYDALTKATINEERIKLINTFLTTYPDSGLSVYVHQIAATTHQQMNNFDKLVEHGEKSLELLPDNMVLLTLLANAYAERNKPDKAVERAQKAIALAEKMEKPAQATDEQWKMWHQQKPQILATNYASMGVAYLVKHQNEKSAANPAEEKPAGADAPVPASLQSAIENLNKAVSLNPKDDFAHYRLGIAYTMANKAEAAINSYARAVALNGYVSGQAKEKLELVYKLTHNNSMDGLDAVVQKAKDEFNKPAEGTSPPPANQ